MQHHGAVDTAHRPARCVAHGTQGAAELQQHPEHHHGERQHQAAPAVAHEAHHPGHYRQ